MKKKTLLTRYKQTDKIFDKLLSHGCVNICIYYGYDKYHDLIVFEVV